GPACTTTYQCPLAGGYFAWIVVRASAAPVPSATTWFSANRIPPGCWQLPECTCEMCDEFDARPVMFSSMVVDVGAVVTMIFPDALVWIPPSTNCRPVGIGLGLGLAAGVGVVAAVEEAPPQATADAVTSISSAIARLTNRTSIGHRSRALPVQVTGHDLRFGPLWKPLSAPPHRASEPPPDEVGE